VTDIEDFQQWLDIQMDQEATHPLQEWEVDLVVVE
jgi:hypothetical protein